MALPKAWIRAFRLRTLPLSLSGTITGSVLALYCHRFDGFLFSLALASVLFLQILSNLANDLGDSLKGTDNADRVGPLRTVQSGDISQQQMKNALVLFSLLSLSATLPLAYYGTKGLPTSVLFIFLALALSCVVAAITYTIGKRAYGYNGWGDVFVFIFFGLLNVCGIYVLMTKEWDNLVLLPASAIGCLSTAVLNLNNLRDHVNDEKSGKRTLVVKMGFQHAKLYHTILLILPAIAMGLFSYQTNDYGFLFPLLIYAVLIPHLFFVWKEQEAQELDSELKKVALSAFAWSLIIGLWVIL